MKSETEIDKEKASKSRPDLIPPRAIEAAGRAFAAGHRKHGTPNGRGTYRISGTDQAKIQTHAASFERHWFAWKRGETCDPESGLAHLDHAMAQLSIVIDLVEDNPDGIDPGPYPEMLSKGSHL